jgi:hypothetical protein
MYRTMLGAGNLIGNYMLPSRGELAREYITP